MSEEVQVTEKNPFSPQNLTTEETSVTAYVREVIERLQDDVEFFIQFYLQAMLTMEIPNFHIDVFRDLIHDTGDDRMAIAIPRGHAKTTFARLACVYYLLFSPYRFIVYMSNTLGVAIPSANSIIEFILSSNSVQIFGEPEFMIKQEGKGFYKFRLMGRICILKAFGADQQVRGLNVDNDRPQLLVCDDMEDNDNIASEDLFLKLKRKFMGPVLKALDSKHNKVIWIGNMISSRSLLYEHCNSKYWRSILYSCLLDDGTPLWPEMWPIEKLRDDFLYYQEQGMTDVWLAEMMNMPISVESAVIDAKDISYEPGIHPQDAEFSFITVDLAISDGVKAHRTVVAVHSWMEDFYQIPVCASWKGIDPIQLFEEIVKIATEWNVQVIGIENVAYQKSLQYVYPHLCRVRGIVGLNFVELHSEKVSRAKARRIIPWAGLLKTGEYRLTRGDYTITNQLLRYDPTKKENEDDEIDCCAYGPQMMERYSHMILTPLDVNTIDAKPLSSYQVCDC